MDGITPQPSTASIGNPSSGIITPTAPKIAALHPKVVDALSETLTECKARGLAVAMHMGLRTPEQQDALYAQGRTVGGVIVTKAKAWDSWHNYGLAVDVVFKDSKGNWTWSESNDWDELGTVGKMFGFEWGGDWTAFPDRPHFQMRGKIPNIKTAKSIVMQSGIDSVWQLV